MKEKSLANYVRMLADYETESGNLGWRNYEAGCTYQVDNHLLAELLGAGVADKLDVEWAERGIPVRRLDAVIPKVTRWFSANGIDTHYLTAGMKTRVPSNLAVWLKLNGLAVAA